MWSRFRRVRFTIQPFPSISTIFRNTTPICVGASIAEWVQKNDEDFLVPTWDQLQSANDHHLSRDDNDINRNFFAKDYEQLIAKYAGKFEDESQREILVYSQEIIEEISGRFGLKNQLIVDVGVGTGVFIDNITKAIGNNGCYIGLDISPAFIYYTNEEYEQQKNVKLNLSKPDSLELPLKLKGKVDVFFVCTTYHHLSDTDAILNQMYDYLTPGGKLVVVELKKHEHQGHKHGQKFNHGHAHEHMEVGQEEWIKKHVPFTEKQAKEEITASGFVFERDILKDNWKNYFVHVYRKPSFL